MLIHVKQVFERRFHYNVIFIFNVMFFKLPWVLESITTIVSRVESLEVHNFGDTHVTVVIKQTLKVPYSASLFEQIKSNLKDKETLVLSSSPSKLHHHSLHQRA